MELIDIGVNLAHDSFDADAMRSSARGPAGVAQMVVTGSSEDSTRKAIAFSKSHRGRLFATAGVHPHHATDVTADTLPALNELARDDHVVAVGECGLDYFRDLSPRDLQRRAFGWQLEIAAATGKPVFLHQRDAHEDFIAILREHRVTRGVAHCFTGTEKERDDYLALGLHIGITGWINDDDAGCFARGGEGNSANRLMVESDAPIYCRATSNLPRRRDATSPAICLHGARDCRGTW
jgi:TatD DNase family protein